MTGHDEIQFRGARRCQWRLGAAHLLFLVAGLLILAACTASSPGGSPNLASILTDDQPQGAGSAALGDIEGQQEEISVERVAAAPRPSGVPKPRPGSANLAPGIKRAIVPNQQAAEPNESATEQIARKPVRNPPTANSLFARLSAPRPARPVATPDEADQIPIDDEEEAQTGSAGRVAPVKRQSTGFFANLFQSNSATRSRGATNTLRSGVVRTRKGSAGRARLTWNTSGLPGVRGKKDIFGIGGVEEEHEFDQGVQLASVTNRARRGQHGLLVQRDDVKVGCFPPKLIRLLRQIERHFGRAPIITSGYRSRAYNRRIRGARNSMHIHCKAADIQVKGVSKRRLARYVRSLPGRGGVGTYCHTRSVHVDVGKKRDWNRRCRRRRARKT